jgi:energy-coupling factor transporter ATP-binding protein EcfA2
MTIQIQSNDRIFICGKTGSGKSYLAKKFLPFYPRVVFYDLEFANNDLINQYHFTTVQTPEMLITYLQHGKKRILYQPQEGDDSDEIKEFNRVCEIVYKTHNIGFMVDELSNFMSGQKAPYWFRRIQQVGRKHGVGCISLTQRPKDIPQILLSESEHKFSFRLELEQDCEKMESVCRKRIDDIETSVGEYPSVYDWKVHIGLISPKPHGKLNQFDIKEKKTPLNLKTVLQDLPYYHFIYRGGGKTILHAPVR